MVVASFMEEGEEMAVSGPPAAWYPDPHLPGVLRWWDGRAWTQHTYVSAPVAPPQPVAGSLLSEPTAAPRVREPVPSTTSGSASWPHGGAAATYTADAYGTRVWFDGQTMSVEATSVPGQAALGARRRDIAASQIRALDLNSPTLLKTGALTVVTDLAGQ